MYLEKYDLGYNPETKAADVPAFGRYTEDVEQPLHPLKYNLDKVMTRLHIIDTKGTDLQVIPITKEWSGSAVNFGNFYGDDWVGLGAGGRAIHQAYEHYINLKTGKQFSFTHLLNDWETVLAPDGETLLNIVAIHPREQVDALYVNGEQIHPVYDADPISAHMSKEAVDKKFEKLMEVTPPLDLDFGEKAHALVRWAADSQSFYIVGEDGAAIYRIWIDGLDPDWKIEEHCARIVLGEMPDDWTKRFTDWCWGDNFYYDVRLDEEKQTLEILRLEKSNQYKDGAVIEITTPKLIKSFPFPAKPQPLVNGTDGDADVSEPSVN